MKFEKTISRFSRLTSSGKFIPAIDGLRFVAITSVVLFHISAHPRLFELSAYATDLERMLFLDVVRKGFYGVQLFFVISGFILAYPFASHHLMGEKPVRLRNYFLRRVTRLEPPYLVSMGLIFLMLIFVKNMGFRDLFPNFAASLVYLHNLIFSGESLINNVAWSLEIEIQFYVLVPLIVSVFAIRDKLARRGVLVLSILLSVVAHDYLIPVDSPLSLTVLNYFQYFLTGFLLADIYIADWGRDPARSGLWDLLSVAGWLTIVIILKMEDTGPEGYRSFERSIIPSLLLPAGILLAYAAAFRGRYSNRLFSNRWITTIGGMCYSIYLLHNFIIGATMRGLGWLMPASQNYLLTFFLLSIILIPAIVVISGLFFITIERPCMDKDWPAKLRRALKLR